ncbi:HET-domain-containing protein, partial [Tothia fuscella]
MDWTLTYCHKAIDSARPHFRLLKLLPAEPLGNGLRCTLDTHSFPPENVEYEALSYTWGKGPKRFRLFVDDDTFAITQNLYNALRRLRHEYKIRTLWIDAICIDQSNSHEKNQQVQFMRDVFANASTVLIWLGESNPAIETMMACSEAQDFVCSRKYKWTDEARRGMSHLIPGALCLLTKDWFNRMWTMQEFLVAKDTRLLCGSGSMLWRSFREMLIPLQDTSPSMTFNGRTRLMEDNLDKKPFGRELYSIMKLEESRKLLDFVPPKGEEEQDVWSLDALLELTVTREATDPRDKIFAL